jgi:hypothetical protein
VGLCGHRSQTLRSLRELDLRYCAVADAGKAALARSETLRYCKITT